MKSYIDISKKYMKENKKRTILTILGVSLATVLIFAIATFVFSAKDAMILQERKISDYEFVLSKLNNKQAEEIANNVEVKDGSIYTADNTIYSIKGTDRTASVFFGDKSYYEKIKREKIIEGEIPSSKNEVIIDVNTKNFLDVNIGDTITLLSEGSEKQFKVCGITSSSYYVSGAPLGFYSYLDDKNLSSQDEYTVYVNIKSKKNKQEIVDKVLTDAGVKVSGETKSGNSELLYLTGNGGDSAITKSLTSMSIFVVAIIVVCTITVIYNSFNISVIERIRYFGVLKAIGATPKQIKRIIFREGLIIGLIAFPLGCILGFFGLKFGIDLFIGDNLLFINGFKINFYPEILLITGAIVAVTIYLSIMQPARKAKKVSAVEAMRNNKQISVGKIKRRKGRLAKKVFGIEGNLAYKNIRRTPARFIITVIALTISLIMFNVFYGFLDYVKQMATDLYGTIPFDSELFKNGNDDFTDEEMKNIQSKNYTDTIYKFNEKYLRVLIGDENLNHDYGESKDGLSYNGVFALKVSNYSGGDKELSLTSKYVKEGDINNKNGVILIDGKKITDKDGNKEVVRGTTYKVGDTIRIAKPIINENNKVYMDDETCKKAIDNNDYIEVPIVAIVDKDPLTGQYLPDGIELFMNTECYEKYIGKFNPNILMFNFNGNTEKEDEALQYFDSIVSEKGYVYNDMHNQLNMMNELFNQVEFFVYCFIIVITIISIVNILNTISTNILIRKKEFSTLKAIGMTEKQLRKSVLLEGTLYGIISGLIGGIVSAILLVVLVKSSSAMAVVEYNFDFVAFLASIAAAILITYIATLVPLKKLSKLSIVEGISEDE